MDPVYLAVLAAKLAVLTFYVGVLVYALPLPLQAVKRWGPLLIWDALLSLLLVALYAILYTLSSRIAWMLGGSWSLFNIWYSTSLSVIMNLKVLLASLTAIPEVARLAAPVYAIAAPLDRAATLALLLLTTIGGLAELIYNYGLILIALGVVLYSIPLRLARGAGAWLVAFTIVFSVGLQTLPLFISNFASEPSMPESPVDYRLLSIRVVDNHGNPAAYGILVLKDASGGLVASYRIDGSGYARSKLLEDKYVLVPALDLIAYLEYDGVLFPLEPRPLRAGEYSNGESIELRAPHIAVIKHPLILAYSSERYTYVHDAGSVFTVRAKLGPGGFIEVRYPDYCDLNVTSTHSLTYGGWEWRGVSGHLARVDVNEEVEVELTAHLGGCSSQRLPSYDDTLDYLEKLLGELRFMDINLLKAFILYYLTIPTIYIFMLFLITGALARVLGGKEKVPVRVA